MGVTAISAPCGAHVSAYGQVVGPGFLCRMFLDVGTSLGCFWCSIKSSTVLPLGWEESVLALSTRDPRLLPSFPLIFRAGPRRGGLAREILKYRLGG